MKKKELGNVICKSARRRWQEALAGVELLSSSPKQRTHPDTCVSAKEVFIFSFFFISYFSQVELLNSPPKQRIHPDTCVPTTKISSQNRDIASTKKYLSISKLFGDIVGML